MPIINILGTKLDLPGFVPQGTLKFDQDIGVSLNCVAGGTWEPNFSGTLKPGMFEQQKQEPESNPIVVNQQPTPLASGGITIPNSSIVFKNPA